MTFMKVPKGPGLSDDGLVFSPAPKIHWPLKAIIALCFPVVTTILLGGMVAASVGFAISFLTTTFAKKKNIFANSAILAFWLANVTLAQFLHSPVDDFHWIFPLSF